MIFQFHESRDGSFADLAAWGSASHPVRDGLLFGADGVGIDRRGAELGVTGSLLHHVERDPGIDGGYPKAVV